MAPLPVSLDDIPRLVLRGISAHFRFTDLLRCRQVCRSWLRAFRDPEVMSGLLGSTLIIKLDGMSPAQICPVTIQVRGGPGTNGRLWTGSFCLWWRKHAIDMPHLQLDLCGQGCERTVDGLLDAFVNSQPSSLSRTLALKTGDTSRISARALLLQLTHVARTHISMYPQLFVYCYIYYTAYTVALHAKGGSTFLATCHKGRQDSHHAHWRFVTLHYDNLPWLTLKDIALSCLFYVPDV